LICTHTVTQLTRLLSPSCKRPTVRRRRRIRWKFLSRDCLAAIKKAILSHCQKPVRSCTLKQLHFTFEAAFLCCTATKKGRLRIFHEHRKKFIAKNMLKCCYRYYTARKMYTTLLTTRTFFSYIVRVTGHFLRS